MMVQIEMVEYYIAIKIKVFKTIFWWENVHIMLSYMQ